MLEETSSLVATPQPWTQCFPDNQLLVDLGLNHCQYPTPAGTLETEYGEKMLLAFCIYPALPDRQLRTVNSWLGHRLPLNQSWENSPY